MGTRFELVLPAGNYMTTRAIGEAALAEIEDCHRRFSRFARSSLLSHIMRSAEHGPVVIDRDTYALFTDALAVHQASGGAFDLTVPAQGMDAIVLDPATSTIRLTREVPLDLGGIAKGHGLDLAAAVLREHGITSAFLHGGTSSAIGIGVATGPGRLEGRARGWRRSDAPRHRAFGVGGVGGQPAPDARPPHGTARSRPRRAVVTGHRRGWRTRSRPSALVEGQRPAWIAGRYECTVRLRWR
jgi:hypothetical protein